VNLQTFLIGAGSVILLLVSVVVVHESGHFVLGKLSGIRVDEFSVGFGPKLWSFKRGETTYALRAIPAGGFVRMAGMLGLQGEADAGERNFYRASIPRRLATIVAGIVFNFIFAAICFTAVNMTPTPSRIIAQSPAALAGLRDGAVILSIDGMAIRHDTLADVSADLHAATTAAQGRPMRVTYRTSDGAIITTAVKPELVLFNGLAGSLPSGALVITAINDMPVGTGDPGALLGAGHQVLVTGVVENADGTPGTPFKDVAVSGVHTGFGVANGVQAAWLMGVQAGFDGEPFFKAAGDGFAVIPGFIRNTVVGIHDLITGAIPGGVTGPNGFTGPVGIAQQTVTAAQGGFLGQGGLVFWIGFVSMNLGFVNMLPIPFLDGGKLLFILIEAVRRRRMNPRNEALASAIGLAVVVLFAIYVTIGDVTRMR
jgi:regulator of sigma E protease